MRDWIKGLLKKKRPQNLPDENKKVLRRQTVNEDIKTQHKATNVLLKIHVKQKEVFVMSVVNTLIISMKECPAQKDNSRQKTNFRGQTVHS